MEGKEGKGGTGGRGENDSDLLRMPSHPAPPFLPPHARARRLIVNSAHLVDVVVRETDRAKAVKELKKIDAGFDEAEFIADLRDSFIPKVAKAFFRFDWPVLQANCGEVALAQCKSAQAARESAGSGRHDGIILSVSKVDFLQAKLTEENVPAVTVSSLVQYLHTVRDKKVGAAAGLGRARARAGRSKRRRGRERREELGATPGPSPPRPPIVCAGEGAAGAGSFPRLDCCVHNLCHIRNPRGQPFFLTIPFAAGPSSRAG